MLLKKILIPIFISINELIKQAKVSFVIGSKLSFFSLNQCFMPLIGLWAGTPTAIAYFVIKSLISYFILGLSLTFYIPTFFASVYLSSSSKLLKAIIPSICILLFLSSYNNYYCLYWLIPIIISFIKTDSIFLKSLGATFTAHAVGTIIWLYLGKFPMDQIYTLASIVWLERLVFAAGMTLVHKTVAFSYNFITSRESILKSNGASI